MKTTFKPVDVIATAQAIYREQGFVKPHTIRGASASLFIVDGVQQKVTLPNKVVLKNHYRGTAPITVTPADRDCAQDIMVFLNGLALKAIERGLSEFETAVLKFVTADSVNVDQVVLASSLPDMYHNKLVQDKWRLREKQLSEHSQFEGTLNEISQFNVTVENIRRIDRAGNYLYCTRTESDNIIKFFSVTDLGLDTGDNVTLSGRVHDHVVNNYHGGKETMLKSVKIERNSVDTH